MVFTITGGRQNPSQYIDGEKSSDRDTTNTMESHEQNKIIFQHPSNVLYFSNLSFPVFFLFSNLCILADD